MCAWATCVKHYINDNSLYTYRPTAWKGYYPLLPDIIRYFPYNFKIHELRGGKNV